MAPMKLAETVENTKTRVLQVGPPNARKTSNWLTWPKPLIIVSYPGEKGYDTIPTGVEGIKSFYWEAEQDTSSAAKVAEVEKLVNAILAGKHGPVKSLLFDGLHKYAEILIDAAADGRFFSPNPEDEIGFAWGRGRAALMDHLTLTMQSTIEHVGFSCWDDYEKARKQQPGERSKDYALVAEHIYPDFFGKQAKRMMGEFSVVCYCTTKRNAQGIEEFVWQIRPGGQVWGAGVKLPPDRAAKLPQFVPTGFESLTKVLFG